MPPKLTARQLAIEIAARPGLIPVEIDAAAQQVNWIDLNGYHCYEGFLDHALAVYASLCRTPPATFTSDLDSLPYLAAQCDCLPPSGFIFHAGRCGSTLLVKSLARSRQNLVFGESLPHNQIWSALAGRKDGGLELYRSLLLLMGRRRLPAYKAYIAKFTSFHITLYPFIRDAFPGVPRLFLFRRPESIVESCLREPPRWLSSDLGIGKTWDTVEAALTDYFGAALAIGDGDFRCLDYADLSAHALPAILRFFGLDPDPGEFALMASEFAWNAKSALPRPFVRRRQKASGCVSDRLRALYEQLKIHAPLEL